MIGIRDCLIDLNETSSRASCSIDVCNPSTLPSILKKIAILALMW
jgi:hypothetical protein